MVYRADWFSEKMVRVAGKITNADFSCAMLLV